MHSYENQHDGKTHRETFIVIYYVNLKKSSSFLWNIKQSTCLIFNVNLVVAIITAIVTIVTKCGKSGKAQKKVSELTEQFARKQFLIQLSSIPLSYRKSVAINIVFCQNAHLKCHWRMLESVLKFILPSWIDIEKCIASR